MKVKLLRTRVESGSPVQYPGSVIEVDEERGETLVGRKEAEAVPDETPLFDAAEPAPAPKTSRKASKAAAGK